MLERDALRPKQTGALPCEAWEAMLAEFMDGVLPPADQAGFDRHAGICPACSQLLVEARQGQEWMRLLEEGPESPAGLVEKILLKTQGVAAPGAHLAWAGGVGAGEGGPAAGVPVPVLIPRVSPMMLERAFHDARLLMTAAMAFFVIALTLSLFGVRLDTVKAAELKPQTLEATFTRQFYENKKQVVSFYDNLRVVYEVESRVQALRREAESESRPVPDSRQDQTPADKPATGSKPAASNPDGTPSSRLVTPPAVPGSHSHSAASRPAPLARRHTPSVEPAADKQPSWHGLPVIAGCRLPGAEQRFIRHGNKFEENATSKERSRA